MSAGGGMLQQLRFTMPPSQEGEGGGVREVAGPEMASATIQLWQGCDIPMECVQGEQLRLLQWPFAQLSCLHDDAGDGMMVMTAQHFATHRS